MSIRWSSNCKLEIPKVRGTSIGGLGLICFGGGRWAKNLLPSEKNKTKNN